MIITFLYIEIFSRYDLCAYVSDDEKENIICNMTFHFLMIIPFCVELTEHESIFLFSIEKKRDFDFTL